MGRAALVDCDIDRGARRGWMGMPRPTLAVVVLMVTRSREESREEKRKIALSTTVLLVPRQG